MAKQVAVIGLGRFGLAVARELARQGQDVIAIDRDDDLVQAVTGQVTYAVRGDATNERTLRDLGVFNYDVAVVAIGSDIQASLLVTVLLRKNMRGKPIIARAIDELHGDALKSVGATTVVSPEADMGIRIAQMEFIPGLLDYMEVAPGFGVSKLRPPEYMHGLTLEDAGLVAPRDRFNVTVLCIRQGRKYTINPARDEVIDRESVLVVAGRPENLHRLAVSRREQTRRDRRPGDGAPRPQEPIGRETPR